MFIKAKDFRLLKVIMVCTKLWRWHKALALHSHSEDVIGNAHNVVYHQHKWLVSCLHHFVNLCLAITQPFLFHFTIPTTHPPYAICNDHIHVHDLLGTNQGVCLHDLRDSITALELPLATRLWKWTKTTFIYCIIITMKSECHAVDVHVGYSSCAFSSLPCLHTFYRFIPTAK